MQETADTKTSDKRDWYKDNQLSDKELKEMLDEKLKRVGAFGQIDLNIRSGGIGIVAINM